MTHFSERRFKTYLFSYGHADARWGFEIQAESPEDAKLRVSRLAFAQYDGELIAKVPVSLGVFARFSVAVQNWFRWLVGGVTTPPRHL